MTSTSSILSSFNVIILLLMILFSIMIIIITVNNIILMIIPKMGLSFLQACAKMRSPGGLPSTHVLTMRTRPKTNSMPTENFCLRYILVLLDINFSPWEQDQNQILDKHTKMCPKTYIVLLCVVLRALHCMVRCVDDKVFHGEFFLWRSEGYYVWYGGVA